MLQDQNKKLIQKVIDEVINKHDALKIQPYVASNFKWVGNPVSKSGVEGFKEALDQYAVSFPDFKANIEVITGDGDYVATRGTITGTNSGSFMGNAPTNKKINVNYIDFWQLENGKIVANWVQIDALALLSQLGIETPEAAHHY